LKYGEYIKTGKKYKPSEFIINFLGINKILERLKYKEKKIKIT